MKKRFNQGYTLIELSIGMVVLGMITVVVWRFGSSASQRIEQIQAPQTLIAADNALIGYIAAKHRLPCPDTAGDGVEHCGGASIGGLPMVTLGLARADLQNVRYGVFRSSTNNADLAVASDSFYPLLAAIPGGSGIAPVGLTAPLGSVNGIDFCHALRLAGALPGGVSSLATALNIRAPNTSLADSILIKNVAYALSLPGTGSNPATNLNTLANSFASPGQPISTDYRDVVLAVDFGQVFDRMSCGGILAAAGHAHPNAASAAAIMRGAMLDYKVQLDLAAEMATTMVHSAAAGVAGAVAGAATAAANVLIAAAESVLSLGTASATIGFAAAAVVTGASAIITNSLTTAAAVNAKAIADMRVKQFSGTDAASLYLLEDSGTLATTLRANAIAADAAGLY